MNRRRLIGWTALVCVPIFALAAEKRLPEWAARNLDGGEVRIAVAAPEDARFAHLSWNKVVRTPKGPVVLAYVAGTFHGLHGDGCPAVSRSTDGGKTFSKMSVLREFGPGMEYTCCGNIALGMAEDGALVLLAMAYKGDEANHIFGWRSEDDGVTWSATDTTSLGPNKTGSVFGSIFSVPGEGLLVAGHYRAGSRPFTQGIWLASSRDHGRTWSEPRRISDASAVEPVLVSSAGRLLGFFRAARASKTGEKINEGQQFVGVSDDKGHTWTTALSALDAENPKAARLAAPCAVENPIRPGEILALTTERTTGSGQNSRIWLWRGDVKTLGWKRERVLIEFPQGAGNPNTDLGYPWLLHVEGNRWQMFYYHGQKKGPCPIWVTEVSL